eukprot:TRINITY_DN40238_c0_g1_i1.p1 TRINITY_DN40238_c0_g1~~TRINITY_DN40238_c0_g1_i1.p1  ORF type:complete len:475 (+),score=90.89 TRINITY_DN40238_c0_g1_i1:107-1426(+)
MGAGAGEALGQAESDAAPPQLLIVSDSAQASCNGVYELVGNTAAEASPEWRLLPESQSLEQESLPVCRGMPVRRVLRAGGDGSWGVWGGAAAEGGACWLRQHGRRRVSLAHQLAAEWRWQDNRGWHDDTAVSVRPVPRQLCVGPAGMVPCAGVYTLGDVRVSGLPTWNHVGCSSALFSTSDGKWAIGSLEGTSSGSDAGNAARSASTHRGALPNQMVGGWRQGPAFGAGAAGSNDLQLLVHAVPSQLELVVPEVRSCSGLYELAEVCGNGMPVWRLNGRQRVRTLFSGSNGKWIVGDADDEKANFNSSQGFMRFPEAHDGLLPTALSGCWEWSDGKQWRVDSRITVAPPTPAPDEEDTPVEENHQNSLVFNFSVLISLIAGKFMASRGIYLLDLDDMLILGFPLADGRTIAVMCILACMAALLGGQRCRKFLERKVAGA